MDFADLYTRYADSVFRFAYYLSGNRALAEDIAAECRALAFGRIVSDTSWDVSPRNFIVVASIAGVFWIAFFVTLIRMRARILIVTPGKRGAQPGR